MTKERLKSYLVGISHTVSKEMSGSSHTLSCYLSKLSSSIKAGKKQPRVWLQYACGVTEVLLYSSLSGPLVFLWSPLGNLVYPNNRVQRTLVFNLLGGVEVRLTQKDLKNEVKMARNGFEDGLECTLRPTKVQMTTILASWYHTLKHIILRENKTTSFICYNY